MLNTNNMWFLNSPLYLYSHVEHWVHTKFEQSEPEEYSGTNISLFLQSFIDLVFNNIGTDSIYLVLLWYQYTYV